MEKLITEIRASEEKHIEKGTLNKATSTLDLQGQVLFKNQISTHYITKLMNEYWKYINKKWIHTAIANRPLKLWDFPCDFSI